MKINLISRINSNCVRKNNSIHFRGNADDLTKLEQIEAEMRALHKLDIINRESYLESTNSDISSAQNTIHSLHSYISSQNNNISQLEQMNDSAKQALIQIEPSLQKLKEKNNENSYLVNDLPNYKTRQINSIMQTLRKIEYDNNVQLDNSTKGLNDSIVKDDILKKEVYKPKKEGLGAIAGFTEIKKQIMTILGEPIVIEKHNGINNVPSGLLLYGPDATNNTEIAFATAKQYDCNVVHISNNKDNNDLFELLDKTSKSAKQLFSNEHRRTIIIIENLEHFIPKDTRESGIFKSIMDNISKKFNITIIATTSHIEALDNKMLRDGRFEKIIVPQISQDDFLAMIKRYIPLEYSNFSFNKIRDHFVNMQKNGAYSVKQVRMLLQSWTGKLQDIITIPEIKKEILLSFEKHKELIKKF